MSLRRKFSRTEKILLCVLAVVALAAVYYYLVYQPTETTIYDAKSQVENLETEILIYSGQAEKKNAMQRELDDLYAGGLAMPIPDYDNLQQLMSFLGAALSSTSEYSLSFPNLEFPTDGSTVVRRRLQMNFIAPDYETARKTLDQLQACPYFCQLQDMTINPIKTDNTGDFYGSIRYDAVQVSLTICYYENQ